ncbi:MAG: ABC transporter substrate-binding protein [Geminicoccaceae bacterium]
MRTLLIAILAVLAQPVQATTFRDLAGREVTLDRPVERLVISEGRYAELLAILRPEEPLRGVVGMMTPVAETLPALAAELAARHPETASIPVFGARSEQTVSVEAIIELAPDLAIFGLNDHGPGAHNAELIAQLEAAGVAIAFIDFRIDPLNNTRPSVELAGALLDAEDRAHDFLAFVDTRRKLIESTVAASEDAPRVFFQAHMGRFDCCLAFADGMLGPFVEEAGGINIADKVAPGPASQHTAEFVLSENPDVLIGSASGSLADFEAGRGFLALGDGITADMAETSLQTVIADLGFQELDAVTTGRTHGIWHNFYNSPLNIVALEAIAAWLHPESSAKLDAGATFRHIYEEFVGFTPKGTYTVSLTP